MGIIGIGYDLVEVERIEKILKKTHADFFLKKVFASEEISYCSISQNKAERYSARFAAKEAFIKATGETEVTLNEICVSKKKDGSPFFVLPLNIQEKLKNKGIKTLHLSITHTAKTAGAFVIAES